MDADRNNKLILPRFNLKPTCRQWMIKDYEKAPRIWATFLGTKIANYKIRKASQKRCSEINGTHFWLLQKHWDHNSAQSCKFIL